MEKQMNTTCQKVLEKGDRKAVVTRITANRWTVAFGYAGQIKVERFGGDEHFVESTKSMAMLMAKSWVDGTYPMLGE